jgi:hypothetical protein
MALTFSTEALTSSTAALFCSEMPAAFYSFVAVTKSTARVCFDRNTFYERLIK